MTGTSTELCPVCDHADRTGSWVDAPGHKGLTHCRRCHGSWSRNTEFQHCVGCCHTFTTAVAADVHREPARVGQSGCLSPGSVLDRQDRPRLVKTGRALRQGTTVDVWAQADYTDRFKKNPGGPT